jgi:hypothetical protein
MTQQSLSWVEGVGAAPDLALSTPAARTVADSLSPRASRSVLKRTGACLACGQDFAVNPHHARAHRFCSPRCRASHHRQLALVRVERHADPAWLEAAYQALLRCARTRESFISDDVWEYGLERTREDRALGAVFIRAKRAGLIEKTDRTRPSVRSHLSGKPVWQSRIYGR